MRHFIFREFNPLFRALDLILLLGSDESASAITEANSTADKDYSALFILFIVFQLTSLGGLVITMLTASLCPMVKKRHLSWSSLMFAWIISCVSYRYAP